MFEYVLLLSLATIAAVVSAVDSFSLRVKRNTLGIAFIVAMLMAALRDMIGGYDVYVYALYFKEVPTLWELGGELPKHRFDYEPLYALANVIIKTIWPDKYFLFAVLASVSYLLLYRHIRVHQFAGIVLFLMLTKFTLASYAYVRQFMSLCILWGGLNYLRKDQPYRYVFVVMIATLFHYSAILGLIALVFRSRAMSLPTIIITLMGSFALGQIGGTKVIGLLLGDVLGSEKLSLYSLMEQEATHMLYLAECILISFFIITRYDRLNSVVPPLHLNLMVLYIAVTLFVLKDPTMLRLHWFFYIGYAVSLSHFVQLFHKRETILVVSLIFLYGAGFYYKELTLRDDGDYMPYKSFVEEGTRASQWSSIE